MSVEHWMEGHHREVVRTAMGVVLAGVAGGGVYCSSQFFTLAHQNTEKDKVIAQLSRNLDDSREQLQVNGIPPTAPSASEVIDKVDPSPTHTVAPGKMVAQPQASAGLPILGWPLGGFSYTLFDPRRRN